MDFVQQANAYSLSLKNNMFNKMNSLANTKDLLNNNNKRPYVMGFVEGVNPGRPTKRRKIGSEFDKVLLPLEVEFVVHRPGKRTKTQHLSALKDHSDNRHVKFDSALVIRELDGTDYVSMGEGEKCLMTNLRSNVIVPKANLKPPTNQRSARKVRFNDAVQVLTIIPNCRDWSVEEKNSQVFSTIRADENGVLVQCNLSQAKALNCEEVMTELRRDYDSKRKVRDHVVNNVIPLIASTVRQDYDSKKKVRDHVANNVIPLISSTVRQDYDSKKKVRDHVVNNVIPLISSMANEIVSKQSTRCVADQRLETADDDLVLGEMPDDDEPNETEGDEVAHDAPCSDDNPLNDGSETDVKEADHDAPRSNDNPLNDGNEMEAEEADRDPLNGGNEMDADEADHDAPHSNNTIIVDGIASSLTDGLGTVWVSGRRRSARHHPPLGSIVVDGLRRSSRLSSLSSAPCP
jgi:hypothetical protein